MRFYLFKTHKRPGPHCHSVYPSISTEWELALYGQLMLCADLLGQWTTILHSSKFLSCVLLPSQCLPPPPAPHCQNKLSVLGDHKAR